MLRRVVIEVAVIVLAFVTAAATALFTSAPTVLDLIFATILMWGVFFVFRLVRRSVARARAERRTASRLESTTLLQAAHEAVVEERVRLAADIEAVVRASVTEMDTSAARAESSWNSDPEVHLVAVQEEGARAMSELRRMLGLLRDAEAPEVAEATNSFPTRGAQHFPMSVVLLCVASFAFVADGPWPRDPDVAVVFYSPWAIILTFVAAATVLLYRRAPALGAAVCAAVFALGALAGAPPSPGFWMFFSVAVLAWTAAASGTGAGFLAVAALMAGIALDLGIYMPVNLPMNLVIVGVAALGGAVAGWNNRRRASANQRVVQRSAELDTAAGDAVRAERLGVARELHDVVSHGIAVMVMQAGAAAALRRTAPERAQTAVTVVRRTAVETLAELERLVDTIAAGALGMPSTAVGSVERDADDLHALISRMEGAGLRISLHVAGPLTEHTRTPVYRIVQEALTNAARHAPGSHVTVTINVSEDGVTIDILDDGPGASPNSGRGYGLVGIAERVASLGGQLTTGPGVIQSGFRVNAQLPAAAAVTQ